MRAIIEIDVPDHQIGQEVSVYFKDTMMIKGIVQESKTDVLIKIRDEIASIYPDDYPCNMRIPERIRDMAVEIVEKYIGDDDK